MPWHYTCSCLPNHAWHKLRNPDMQLLTVCQHFVTHHPLTNIPSPKAKQQQMLSNDHQLIASKYGMGLFYRTTVGQTSGVGFSAMGMVLQDPKELRGLKLHAMQVSNKSVHRGHHHFQLSIPGRFQHLVSPKGSWFGHVPFSNTSRNFPKLKKILQIRFVFHI